MRLKFTIFVLLFMGFTLNAQEVQDTIDYLIITEWRGDNTHMTYLELTNVGDQPVPLNQFKIGHWGGGSTLVDGQTNEEDYWIPVDVTLAPGESYLFCSWDKDETEAFNRGVLNTSEKQQQDNVLEKADFRVDLQEGIHDVTFTPGLSDPFNQQWGPGMNGFYIEYHFPSGDSVVVDQVCGMFTGENGENLNRTQGEGYDVAGVAQATGNSYLIRRHNVTKGNLDFANARGTGLDDSEWIPIPLPVVNGGAWRSAPWTIGNHGDYNLDATTLESDDIVVDFDSKTLTVPWGVRRGDDIMNHFTEKPGIGWEYIVGPEDSLSWAVHTGDQLVIYVCGNDLDKATFDIIAADPGPEANIVVPVTNQDPDGDWREAIESGILSWPRITQHESGMDTIYGFRGGIPYATRVDTLQERTEKPSNAEWEIVYAGEAKPDLSHGDILKITSENGTVKEYFISMREYVPSHNAKLSAITWPDIPEFYKKPQLGWNGDTIYNFVPEVYNYNIIVPALTQGIPALHATKMELNSQVEVTRAEGLVGKAEDRTIKFTVTAEDDTTVNDYKVILNKEVLPENIQPNEADPFISQVTKNVNWSGNDYLEIYNPGNQPIDLSNYMLAGVWSSNPVDAITVTNADNWMMRYEKYIPGRKWEGEENWAAQQYFAQPDLSVNATLQPQDVFVMGYVGNGNLGANQDWEWPGYYGVDVQFNDFTSNTGEYTITNQWGEEIAEDGTPFTKWHATYIYLFKILNDSVRQGLKPATDPNDFELIDVIGNAEGGTWVVGDEGNKQPFSFMRKPEVTEGNPVIGASFGTTREDAEWYVWDTPYWNAQGFGWPWNHLNVMSDLGKHYGIPSTTYLSTISSLVYIVSDGYSMEEEIRGVTTGTTVNEFIGNLIKAHEDQTLTVTSTADGSVLGEAAVLSMNDTLTVLSADSTNTSKYILEVTDEGLSSDALITSSTYTVEVGTQPSGSEPGAGTVTGISQGTLLKTVVQDELNYPAGSRMEVIDASGAYLPFKIANYDTTYVDLTVNNEAYIKVTAEDGVTSIVYQLLPEFSSSDAFVTSFIFSVDQSDLLIADIPLGISTRSFLDQLTPAPGATIQLIDKGGFERTDGTVALDDKLVVTSEDGENTAVYFLDVLAPTQVFFAYLLSDVYLVDQVNYSVTVRDHTSTETFISNVNLSVGATMVIYDADGNERTSGDLVDGDVVTVTAGDGVTEVSYSVNVTETGLEDMQNAGIQMFPNPSNGLLNVTGLQPGQTIKVLNSVGMVVETVDVHTTHEVLSLDNQPAGIYLIIVGDKDELIGRYKAIKY
mgnify:CR=1 FL=1